MKIIYECDICGHYHPWDWDGDCRDDRNRFSSPESYALSVGCTEENIDVRTMDERIDADN